VTPIYSFRGRAFTRTRVPGDKTKFRRADRERIDVNEGYELRDWSTKFGISKEELQRAVQQVGDSAEAVRKHLGN
jgi:hypothetical protein